MSTILSFKDRKNKKDGYRDEDCIKKFCECLKKHVRGILILKRRKWSY